MPEYFYQIRGRTDCDEMGDKGWEWPPLFCGVVTADDKKAAKVAIDEEYGRKFPLRVLRADIQQHAFLLRITEVDPQDDYTQRKLRFTACLECGDRFRPIDKYNDPHADYRGLDYCSKKCKTAGQTRDVSEFRLAGEGRLPPVIYQVRQKTTGRVYVGQTIKPFTLRWWQHLTTLSDCKFHEALKLGPITDFEFSVLEVITVPDDCSASVYITDRERHWIDVFDSVKSGFNTIRPTGISPQKVLDLENAIY